MKNIIQILIINDHYKLYPTWIQIVNNGTIRDVDPWVGNYKWVSKIISAFNTRSIYSLNYK